MYPGKHLTADTKFAAGSFYVMFAGALVTSNTPAADVGYISANFVYASSKYGTMDWATFHKF